MKASEELQALLCSCTVKLLTSEEHGYGTGFFVAPHLLLTCAHVVGEATVGQSISVVWKEQRYTAIIQHIHAQVHPHFAFSYPDLALLAVADLNNHPCVYLDEDITLYEDLYSYGYTKDYPYGDSATFECEGWTDEERLLLKLKEGQAQSGLSGAPILNSRTGGVCGIMKRSRETDGDLGARAVPTWMIFQTFPALKQDQHDFHQHNPTWMASLARWQHEQEQPSFPQKIWTVPYPHNPFFTGREHYLDQLHTNLLAQKAAALTQPQAINGLGGIGKTQIAVEYAHRHRETYPYVFWVNAATSETLLTDFITLAKLLGLSLSSETDQETIVTFVKNWLDTHERWLLILDNADDFHIVRAYLPTANRGHIILTTRKNMVSSFKSIEVHQMTVEESTDLLLRRANILDTCTEEDTRHAMFIATEMDGLPLALDQAGAYIEEMTCSVAEYLSRYNHQQHMELLSQRGEDDLGHSDPVTRTWTLNFGQVTRNNPMSANLMQCCTFLAPDTIPEEMFLNGGNDLGSVLHPMATNPSLFDQALKELRRFSLVQRNADTRTVSIHRLVQAVTRENMDEATQNIWAERAVRLVNHSFPGKIDVTTWKQCQQYITHAQVCATWIEHYHLAFPEAATLLNQAAYYLQDLALYPDAEPLYQRALRISEQVVGPEHPNTATSLNNLAGLYRSQGKYAQAEPLYQRALRIREQVVGSEHPDTASSLNNLAALYDSQGKYEQAEPLYQRALRIREQVLGPEHPNTASSLNNLAALYRSQGKYAQAEPLYQRALRIREHVLGPEHPDTATSLNNLALLYDTQGKYEQAEPLYQRALRIREQVLGSEHPDTASSLNNLAGLYDTQGKYEQAEPLYQRALRIREQVLGPEHPDTAQSLNNLALLYQSQGKYEQAEPLYQRALAIMEKTPGREHPNTKIVRGNYTQLRESLKQKKGSS